MSAKKKILDAMMPGWEYRTCDLTKVYFDAGALLRSMERRYREDKFAPPITKREGKKYVYYKKLY